MTSCKQSFKSVVSKCTKLTNNEITEMIEIYKNFIWMRFSRYNNVYLSMEKRMEILYEYFKDEKNNVIIVRNNAKNNEISHIIAFMLLKHDKIKKDVAHVYTGMDIGYILQNEIKNIYNYIIMLNVKYCIENNIKIVGYIDKNTDNVQSNILLQYGATIVNFTNDEIDEPILQDPHIDNKTHYKLILGLKFSIES